MRRVFARDFAAGIRPGAALALFRVFAVPRLSARLAGTGGWEQGPSTRLECTVELLAASRSPTPTGQRSKSRWSTTGAICCCRGAQSASCAGAGLQQMARPSSPPTHARPSWAR